jgi:hypothetical protein
MTLKDHNTSSGNPNRTPQVRRLLQPTCPECSSELIFRGWPGYVCRNFIKAVACDPETEGTGENTSAVPGSRIVYGRLPDGSLNVDYDEDNYDRSRYEDDEFFACAECEQVLQFENGSEVRSEAELVEWLTLNSEQAKEDQPDERLLRCRACGNETFFINQVNAEARHDDDDPSDVCTKCGSELKA